MASVEVSLVRRPVYIDDHHHHHIIIVQPGGREKAGAPVTPETRDRRSAKPAGNSTWSKLGRSVVRGSRARARVGIVKPDTSDASSTVASSRSVA